MAPPWPIPDRYTRYISLRPPYKLHKTSLTISAEAAWGADPLEYHGGFPSLHPNNESSFPSSLTSNATAKWSSINASSLQTSEARSIVSLAIEFPTVDWPFLQQVYGWSALQWQAWTRGEIHVAGSGPTCVTLHTP